GAPRPYQIGFVRKAEFSLWTRWNLRGFVSLCTQPGAPRPLSRANLQGRGFFRRRASMDITDKVALITGTRRIGSVVAVELARKGAHVVLGYNRSREEAEGAARKISDLGRKALSIQADVSKLAEVQSLVQRAVNDLGRIDVLINMASIYRSKPFVDTTEEDWDANINVNLKSAFLCAKAVTPLMKASGGGRIINFADWIAASGRPRYKGFVPYYVSKA